MSSEFSRQTAIVPIVSAFLGACGAVTGSRQSHRRSGCRASRPVHDDVELELLKAVAGVAQGTGENIALATERAEAAAAGGYVPLREAQAGHWIVVGDIDRRPGLTARTRVYKRSGMPSAASPPRMRSTPRCCTASGGLPGIPGRPSLLPSTTPLTCALAWPSSGRAARRSAERPDLHAAADERRGPSNRADRRSLRGRAKTEVALRDGLSRRTPTSRLAEFAAAD